MYTQAFIDELLNCNKQVKGAWNNSSFRGSIKKVIMLQSVDRKYDFTAFYTKNNYFPENFSFGLVYVSRNEIGKVPIIRCNGLHGPTNAWEHHSYTHSHKPTVEGLNAGNKEGTLIERLEEYSTFETAMPYFGNVIKANEIDRIKYFPSPNVVKQTDLFSGPQ